MPSKKSGARALGLTPSLDLVRSGGRMARGLAPGAVGLDANATN